MAEPGKADLVLTNGIIFRGRGLPLADTLAVSGERILATGRADDLDGVVGPHTEVIDLSGAFACPGLIDSHLHLLPLGLMLGEVDVRPDRVRSVAELVAAIRARAQSTPAGRWIVARGYDHHRLSERRHPTRDDLDAAAPGHPVYVIRACGHAAVANSAALALAGVVPGVLPPSAGRIELATGLLEEGARELIRRVLPATSDADLVEAIEVASRHCLQAGLTAVTDAAVGAKAGLREIAAYRAADACGRLAVRAHLALVGGQGGIVDAAEQAGYLTGWSKGRVSVGPAKLFADGSAGARTAALSAGYEDKPDSRGTLYLSDDRLRSIVADYHRRGWQIAVHAVGDLAIEQVLDAYARALAERPEPGRRHRIEHATFTSPEQIAKMARLGIEPVPQPIFLRDYGAMYVGAVGARRANSAFPVRSWLTAGLRPSGSTDAPISALDPVANLAAFQDRLGPGCPASVPEGVSGEEALACYTEHGAWLKRMERSYGRLLPGMVADISVFSQNLVSAEPDTIRSATCVATFVAGRTSFLSSQLGPVRRPRASSRRPETRAGFRLTA